MQNSQLYAKQLGRICCITKTLDDFGRHLENLKSAVEAAKFH